MAGETMIRTANPPQPKRGVADSFSDVIGDVATLAELQFDLLKLDCAESRRQIALPITAIVTGLLFAAGLFPALLLLISAAIYEFAELPLTASIGIASAIGLFISGVTVFLGLRGVRKALVTFKRSSEELRRNVEWMKNLKKRNRSHEANTRPASRI